MCAKPSVIMYSFPSEDGSTNTVPLLELPQVDMTQNDSQVEYQDPTLPKIVSVTSSSLVPLIDLASAEATDSNKIAPQQEIVNHVQPQTSPNPSNLTQNYVQPQG